MSTASLDRIIEEVRTLTADERRELRELLQKDERTADLRRVQEKHKLVRTSSDAFAARKAEEIELEDRPRR